MNILVFGSTGPTGRELVKLALEQGHRVTAFARNPDDLVMQHERLIVTRGDITDAAAVAAAMPDQQAVLSTLGVRKIARNSIISNGTRHILDAMKASGIRRFICETSIGVGDSKYQMGWIFDYLILPTLLRNAFADKEIQERYIMQSELDWVIARPAMLTNSKRTGNYLAWVGKRPPSAKMRISRADVAHFMLGQLEETKFVRQAVGLSY